MLLTFLLDLPIRSDSDSRLGKPGRRASPGNAVTAVMPWRAVPHVQTSGTQITRAHCPHPRWATEGTRVPNRALVSRAPAASGRSDALSARG
eukprot:4510647-Alexandrium_andersonii.AAC.1